MLKEQLDHNERIITDPNIMVGKPVVRGTRIPDYIVLEFLAENPDLDELFAAYPRLTLEDVKACLAYAEHGVVAASAGGRHRKGRTITEADHKAALSAFGGWKGLVDAEQLKRDLDAARSDNSPPVDL